MPCRAHSSAMDFVIWISAAFEVAYGPTWPETPIPRIEAMLTMAPPDPELRIHPAQAFATRKAPLRLVSSTASNRASSVSSQARVSAMPALLTRMSMPPSPAITSSMPAATLAPSETSSRTATASCPAAIRSAATRWQSASRRAAMATCAPSRASNRAKCSPRPPDAPVTSARLPFKPADKADLPAFRQA